MRGSSHSAGSPEGPETERKPDFSGEWVNISTEVRGESYALSLSQHPHTCGVVQRCLRDDALARSRPPFIPPARDECGERSGGSVWVRQPCAEA